MADQAPRREEGVITRQRPKAKGPRRWKVLLHNDDYTTMEFVVQVLMTHFRKGRSEAVNIMLRVHHIGVGVAGVYPKDEAETKAAAVIADARANGMPLMLTTEPE